MRFYTALEIELKNIINLIPVFDNIPLKAPFSNRKKPLSAIKTV